MIHHQKIKQVLTVVPEMILSIIVCCCQIFCFYHNSMLKILENGKLTNKKIYQIKTGDKVLTYNGKEKVLTKVTKNKKNKGLFEFYTIKCKDIKSNVKMISITGNHTMIVYRKAKGEAYYKCADQVKIGEMLMTTDGLFEVYEINKEMMNDSYEMRVENGNVLANDILVSTLYLEKNKERKCHQKIVNPVKNTIGILN